MTLNLICSLLVPCNIGHQTMKIMIYINYLGWHRFILHLITDDNHNENIGLQGYNLKYNAQLFPLTWFKSSRVKNSRELLIMMIITNVLLVIINNKNVNMFTILFNSLWAIPWVILFMKLYIITSFFGWLRLEVW